jgi:guanylate kinase
MSLINVEKGLFFVISAPSGAGKTTLVRKLTKEFHSVVESISYTTRKKREGEIEGKDYFFISKEKFEEKIKNKEFLEYAHVFGNYYGTSKKWIEEKLKKKKHIVLVIDTQGAKELRGKIKGAFIFIVPPNIQELKNRLLKRKDHPKEIEKRISWAENELKEIKNYDYKITNEDLKTSYDVLRSIIIAEVHRIKKMEKKVE